MVIDNLKNIMSKITGVNKDDINEETNFQDLGMDSLEIFEMIVDVEDQFDIEIPNEDVEKFACVGDVLKYIHERIK